MVPERLLEECWHLITLEVEKAFNIDMQGGQVEDRGMYYDQLSNFGVI